jgi:hypothetical protein
MSISGTAEDDVRRIITHYFLVSGEAITGVEQGRAALIVSAGARSWTARVIERGRNFQRSAGYTLYRITPELVSDPPTGGDGFAVLPGGHTFHLNDQAGFQAFYASARTLLQPLELACLLAWYQSPTSAGEAVIAETAELDGLLTPAQVAALPHLTSLLIDRQADGGLVLLFCTYSVSAEPPDYLYRVDLYRWRVEADASGELTWVSWPLARRLDSPRYTPGKAGPS